MTWINVSGRKLPVGIKPFLKKTLYRLVPMRLRMGRHYWQLRNFLEKAQWWKRAKIKSWQLKRLQEIVSYAYHQVPGYRTLYDEAGTKPEDIHSLADVRRLPFVTKTLYRKTLKTSLHGKSLAGAGTSTQPEAPAVNPSGFIKPGIISGWKTPSPTQAGPGLAGVSANCQPCCGGPSRPAGTGFGIWTRFGAN